VQAIAAFWRGQLPLGRSFWSWGILGGAAVELFSILLVVALLVADVPAWLAALAFAVPFPETWSCSWESGAAPGGPRSAAAPLTWPGH
jgi:hypothetical protein